MTFRSFQALEEGNARFVSGNTEHRNLPSDVRSTARGQRPFAVILSCMDSRVPIELVFDLTIGEAFSVRVAGNVVNRDVLGSLEYATKVAEAKLVVVLGHTGCAAVTQAIEGGDFGNLSGLVSKIRPAVAAAGPGSSKDSDYVDRVSEQNVRQSMKEIRAGSRIVTELLESGAVRLVGGVYDVETGQARFFD